MKIAVLLSGGVDSSVALRLLKEQGHDVTAFYLKIWLQDDFSFLGECPWEEDVKFASAVCDQAGVELKIVPLQNEYWDLVVSYTIDEIKAGRTPNPDIFCNSLVKFGQFFNKIDESYEKVATGHYGEVIQIGERFGLRRSPDPIKDQTYFLCYLSQEQLRRALFPIGHLEKHEVRSLAHKYELATESKKDSQGICFLGRISFRDFIRQHLGDLPGDIVNADTGETMGTHSGYYYYTIGQRSGIGLHGGPWYVVAKDTVNNKVYISRNKVEDQQQDTFTVGDCNWFFGEPNEGEQLQVKIRHGARLYDCVVNQTEEGKWQVKLAEPDGGIAAGQFAVFYRGDICLGGTKILESTVIRVKEQAHQQPGF